jgi:CubicO group peptidase (beta-lactamase class C family)
VRQCFAEIAGAQPGTGAAFAVWCDGQLVVDLWGGYADQERRRRWEADSLVQLYSVSKPFAAVCALRLVEAGRRRFPPSTVTEPRQQWLASTTPWPRAAC